MRVLLGDLGLALHVLIVAVLAVRIVLRRRPTGESLAWIALIAGLPYLGAVAYLVIGEKRLGSAAARRAAVLVAPYRGWAAALATAEPVPEDRLAGDLLGLHRLAEATTALPPLPGNRLELHHDAASVLRAIAADVDAAAYTCHLELYIWNEGGAADLVAEALMRARGRGVACRVLLDDVGSRPFLQGDTCRRLREVGVEVEAAFPVGLLRALFVRSDVRLHRKIVVVDGRVAWTGSMNLVDPAHFRTDAGVGQWVDAMVRIEGRTVEALGATFLTDWLLHTGQSADDVLRTLAPRRPGPDGDAVVQVVPSGPGTAPEAIYQVLLATVYGAREELVITTPYFVPDDALLTALLSAARRGVRVTIVVPRRNDSRLVYWASRSFYDALLGAGVRVLRFGDGLLHVKSVTVDGQLALFGSVNLDMRSIWLNFEISLIVYDEEFVGRLHALQRSYCARSEALDPGRWADRSPAARFLEGAARLLAPLL